MKLLISGVIKTGDVPDKEGVIYSSESLRAMADGICLHWIEDTKQLVYGELVADSPGVDIDAVHRNPRWAQKGK